MSNPELEVFYPGVYSPQEQEALNHIRAGRPSAPMGGPGGPGGPGGHEGPGGPGGPGGHERPGGPGGPGKQPEQGNPAGSGPEEHKPTVWQNYKFSEPLMLLYAGSVNRFDPLYNDVEYAKHSWYGGLPAYPGYASVHGGMIDFPRFFGEHAMMTEQRVGDGYDNELQYYKPILAGDTITAGKTTYDVYDATDPAGSTVRVFIGITDTEMVNQRGEVVGRSINRMPTLLSRQKDGQGEEHRPDPRSANLHGLRTQHHYTEADFDLLRDYWSKEKIRGAEPLYFEDVQVGDYLNPTAEVPMSQFGMFRMHMMEFVEMCGTDVRDILCGRGHGPSVIDEYGIPDSDMLHFKAETPGFYNFTGRNFCLRMVTNWMGDTGFVTRVNWRMVNNYPEGKKHNAFPEGYFRPSYLLEVPELKEQGVFIDTHGAAPDAIITRGYVYGKRVENGEHLVDIACWCQDLDGHYNTECGITVRLPAKQQ